MVSLPRPVQERLPILYGVAMTAANAEHIAEWGDGWCPVGLTDGQLRVGIDRLREAFDRVGRDARSATVRVRPPQPLDAHGRIDLEATFEAAARQRELGVDIVAFGPPVGIDSLAGIAEFIESAQRTAAAPPRPTA